MGVPTTTLDPGRSLDDRRALIFGSAAVVALLSGIAQRVWLAPQAWWEFASAIVCALAAWLMRQPSQRVRTVALAGLATFFLVSVPLVAAVQARATDLVVMLVLPLALTVIFIDRPSVVALVCVTGLIGNPLTLHVMHWELHDILHATGAMVALYGAGVMGALEYGRLRKAERKQHESMQRLMASQLQSERLVVLGTLAAGVAHEVNNPLSFVLANVQHLQKGELSADERSQVFDEMLQGLRRIGALVDDLRGIARPGSNDVQPVLLEPLLRQAARLVNLRGSRARVEVKVSEAGLCGTANEQRLLQVLLNLAVNACNALEAKQDAPLIVLSATREGERVVLDVDDNGPGVPEAAREVLFTPFFTTRPDVGTGLGLTLSREYVQAFGGTLTCETSPLGGARFRVSLAAASP